MRDSAATRIQAVARGKRSRKRKTHLKARPEGQRPGENIHGQFDHEQDRYGDGIAENGSALGFGDGGPSTVKGGGASVNRASAVSSSPDTTAAAESEGRGKSVEVKIDRKAVELIASLVDERIMVRRPNASLSRLPMRLGTKASTMCCREGLCGSASTMLLSAPPEPELARGVDAR